MAAPLGSGRYDRHLRRMRAICAGRRARLIAALARHASGIRLTGLAAGFHAAAHLPGVLLVLFTGLLWLPGACVRC